MTATAPALAFLDRIERSEAGLLGWGHTDGYFTEAELEERADAFVSEHPDSGFFSGWEVVQTLVDARLLWPIAGRPQRYRTRMAEGIRLLTRLRQIFHGDPDAWRGAPALVSDYRLLLRPRTYPRRAVEVETAVEALRNATHVNSVQIETLRALLHAGEAQPLALSEFQLRALSRIAQWSGSRRAAATVVCAGTGSGKTLAFYLPVYVMLASRISSDPWTKCLAIYPRKELLKDQFRAALANAQLCAAALKRAHGRGFSLGALYDDVPRRASDLLAGSGERRTKWEKKNSYAGWAFVCPYVLCPRPKCKGSMLWLEALVKANQERLQCSEPDCGMQLGPEQLRLTRERLLESPPDILFTTTEMMNQRMSSARYGRLFGIGLRADRRPLFMLLDEVHTYEGLHGAHVALLLRRWRKLSEARPHFVGLSATLAEAQNFFADLVGVGPGDVVEVSPQAEEMFASGMEYLLALKGDASSGTSLLSTTIQVAMLLRRLLEPARQQPHFGSRVFAFTDNLDVTNRLYHSLLDAEGWDPFGRPNPQQPGSLANIRAPGDDDRERLAAGQNWSLVEWIGHVLAPGQRARVGRTSSQDAGVSADAEIVVATSALEVGFDDPEVGAVLQHKAPLTAAAFQQRKGRAGRRQDMRPFTVVVLSDYGRDRSAYQSYERLFSPDLPSRRLPLANRAVLRMQATYALIDWLTRRLPSPSQNPWIELSCPADPNYPNTRQRQEQYAAQLLELLNNPAQRADLADFIGRSLDIDDDTVSALLWEPPRALLMEAVPTLLRRLERGWAQASGTAADKERFVMGSPLPEFIPRALFSDLQLPEVIVQLPQQGKTPAWQELMPIGQALREFAPGRVSRRFGVRHARQRFWIAPDADDTTVLDKFCPEGDRVFLGRFPVWADGQVQHVPVFHPRVLAVSVPPVAVRSSSNGFLDWHVHIVAPDVGHDVDRPEPSAWAAVFEPLRFFTHHLGNPIEIRRFTTSSYASIGRGRAPNTEHELQFVSTSAAGTSAACGLGFVADVDALCLRFHYPRQLFALCENDPRLDRSLRFARFCSELRNSQRLDGIANVFQREILAQTYIAALTVHALVRNESLPAAIAAARAGTIVRSLRDVMVTLMQGATAGPDGDDGEDDQDDEDAQPGNASKPPRRLQEALDCLQNPLVGEELHRASALLHAPIDDAWEPWLRERYRVTLGLAFLAAAHNLCPRMASGTLLLDLDARPERPVDAGDDEMWLTESVIGGGGFVEEFLDRYAADPRKFFVLLAGALGPTDIERTGERFIDVLTLLRGASEHPLHDALRQLREADGHTASSSALHGLRKCLSDAGIPPSPSLLVSLNARLVREGSSALTDAFLAERIHIWCAAEERLGIEIDPRAFALASSFDEQVDEALPGRPAGAPAKMRETWRYNVLAGLLFPRGAQIRSEALRSLHPYAMLPDGERLLVLAAIARPPRISLDRDDWFDALARALITHGAAEIAVPALHQTRLAEALLHLAREPIDADTMLVHCRLLGVRRDAAELVATLELPEAEQ